MKIKYFLPIIIPFLTSSKILCQSLTFNELTLGIDARNANFYQWEGNGQVTTSTNPKSANYLGTSARFSTSFLANCYANKFTKWRVADVLIGEVGIGYAESNFDRIKTGLFPTYDFTIGFGAIFKLNKKQDIGLNFGMLRFARSLQSRNFSGCNFYLKYRYDKILVELGIQSWNEFYVSWIYILNSRPNPLEFSAALKYLITDKHLVGIRAENNTIYTAKPHITPYAKEYFWNLRLFYGIYF